MLFKIIGKHSNNCEASQLPINENIVKCSRVHLDDKEIDISLDDVINDLNFPHTNLHIATNKKCVELQSLVPVVVEGKEEGPFNDNKVFNDNNDSKVIITRQLKKAVFAKPSNVYETCRGKLYKYIDCI